MKKLFSALILLPFVIGAFSQTARSGMFIYPDTGEVWLDTMWVIATTDDTYSYMAETDSGYNYAALKGDSTIVISGDTVLLIREILMYLKKKEAALRSMAAECDAKYLKLSNAAGCFVGTVPDKYRDEKINKPWNKLWRLLKAEGWYITKLKEPTPVCCH